MFDALADKYEDIAALSIHQLNYIKAKVAEYWNFVYGDATGIAYLLDPIYVGDRLTEDMEEKITKYISEWRERDDAPPATDAQKQAIVKELDKFRERWRTQKNNNTDAYKTLPHPRTWWNINQRRYSLLSKIALRVFNMAASSASTERSFSTNGFLHSKLRNSLKPDTVQKLTYLKLNHQHAYPSAKKSKDSSDSDDCDSDSNHSEF
jgi:hypothetical protein